MEKVENHLVAPGIAPGHFRFRLLGGFRVERSDGGALEIKSANACALLAYLAVHQGRAQRREKLAELLWPDRSNDQARHSLRQALLEIRKYLADGGPCALMSKDDTLRLDSDTVEVDAVKFEGLAGHGGPSELDEALALYDGEFLDGLSIRSTDYMNWISHERSRLHDAYCSLLMRLARYRKDAGDIDAAIDLTRRLIEADPFREEAHRNLIELLVAGGRRNAAIAHFQKFANTLKEEVGVEPDEETQALYQSLRGAQPAGSAGEAAAASPAMGTIGARPLELPKRPSIAVLPFEYLGTEPQQTYFADGIAENIISALGRFRALFVIARNSSFVFRNHTLPISEIARALGVRYVLQGTIYKSEGRIRIAAELTDAPRDHHLWSDHYDCEMADIFNVQDEITYAVISTVFSQVLSAEAERARRKELGNLDSWDYVMRARWYLWHFNQADNEEARRLLFEAIALDPYNAQAHADLAGTYAIEGLFGWSDPATAFAAAYQAAQKALEIDEEDAWSHAIVGIVLACMRQHDTGIHRIRTAIELNPNLAGAYGFLALAETFAGNSKTAIDAAQRAMRLSPRDKFLVLWYVAMAAASFTEKRFEDAVGWARLAVEERSDFPSGHRLLAASYGQLGNIEKAREAVAEVRRLIPDQSLENLRTQLPYRDPDVVENFLEGLRKGGLEA